MVRLGVIMSLGQLTANRPRIAWEADMGSAFRFLSASAAG